MEYHIGTDTENFSHNRSRLWNDAILNAFTKGSARARADQLLMGKIKYAIQIHSERFAAFPWLEPSGNPNWMFKKFAHKAKVTLAQNLEKCGRTQDAAKILEELHMYDEARKLRERAKQVIVRRTNVSVNLNALLKQIKDGGIVVIYRCPHCSAPLKIGKDTNIESLRICEHCKSEIEAVDVADFLKAALS